MIYTASEMVAKYRFRTEEKRNKPLLTGFPDVDNLIGDEPMDLIVIGARPAVGKLSMAMSMILRRMKRNPGFTVLIWSSYRAEDVIPRLLSIYSGVDLRKIKADKLNEGEQEMVRDAADFLAVNNFHFADGPLTISDLQAAVESISEEMEGLDLVVIDEMRSILPDYISCTESYEPEEVIPDPEECAYSSSHFYTDACSRLKKLAVTSGCQIICLTTLSRMTEVREDHFPLITDLRSYGKVDEIADAVLLIYRDEYYDIDTTYSEGTMDVAIAKAGFTCDYRARLRLDHRTTGVEDYEDSQECFPDPDQVSPFAEISDDDIPFWGGLSEDSEEEYPIDYLELDFIDPSPLRLEGAEERIRKKTLSRAVEIYGLPLPMDVQNRLDSEIETIVPFGFATRFDLCAHIAETSHEMGYPVRLGETGASFVSMLLGATDINPMPDEADLFYETLTGFEKNKTPEIKVYVAPEVREEVLKMLEHLIGKEHVLKPASDPNAVVLLPESIMTAELLPSYEREDLDRKFTTIDLIPDLNLSKLHDLEAATGYPLAAVFWDDHQTLQIFADGDTDGIPFFEQSHAKRLLALAAGDTGYSCSFEDLMKVLSMCSGYGNYTDIEAREKEIAAGKGLEGLVCSRDEVMRTLLDSGLTMDLASETVEAVWKGKLGAGTPKAQELEEKLKAAGVDESYIGKLKAIRYLPPKAALISRMQVCWRFGWYKAHAPAEFETIVL